MQTIDGLGVRISALVLAVACAGLPSGTSAEERLLDASAVPKVGRVVKHPTDSNTVIRVVSSYRDGFSWRKRGLYVSKDGGKMWKLLQRQFDFAGAFYIHPDTGIWFAGIVDSWLETGGDGYLRPAYGYKIVMSHDGTKWKDITGKDGHVIGVAWFNRDPDSPKRVCVRVASEMSSLHRTRVLQSTDDKYSSWTSHRWGSMSKEDRERFTPPRLLKRQNDGGKGGEAMNPVAETVPK